MIEAPLTPAPNAAAVATGPSPPNVPVASTSTHVPPVVDGAAQANDVTVPTVEDLTEEKAVRNQLKKEKEIEANAQIQHENERALIRKKNLETCRNYFIAGCFGLPWLHFVSFAYFCEELKSEDGDVHTRKYIVLSFIIGLIEIFICILWIVVFQVSPDDSPVKGLGIVTANDTLVGKLAR